MQGALPPAPPASPRNSRGATPCQAINFDIFRHIERECSQGFKGGDFRRKYYPSLDGTERHTALAEGKATRLSLLPHGECGVWGNAPRVKFRDGVRPPFSKGEEDWGLPPASEYRSRSAGGKAPFSPLQQLQQMYQRQLNLNQLLEKSERDGRAKDKQIADLQTENTSLRGQIRSLTVQIDQIKAELWNKINNLTDKLKGAYESLTNVVKAVGMLKYDREKDQNGNYTYGKYGISNLSKAQDKLIDGLAEYGAKWAKEDGFPEMAEEMEKRVGISKGIEKIIEPQAPKRSHYHDGPSL